MSTLNADPAELARFNALAERWWDGDSEFRPLHEINPLRLEWIARQCPLRGAWGGRTTRAHSVESDRDFVLTAAWRPCDPP